MMPAFSKAIASTVSPSFEVRRGEQADAVAGVVEDRLEHRAGRALALAAGDVDEPQLLVRVAEPVQQGAHAVELEVARLWRGPFEIDAAEPVGQRLVVGHECSLAMLALRCASRLNV